MPLSSIGNCVTVIRIFLRYSRGEFEREGQDLEAWLVLIQSLDVKSFFLFLSVCFCRMLLFSIRLRVARGKPAVEMGC